MCTKELINKLNLNTYRKVLQISGISQTNMYSNEMIDLKIHSNSNLENNLNVSCAVLEKITCNLPQLNINVSSLKLPKNIEFADPEFYISSAIDILLGADVYYILISPGIIRLCENLPILLNTILGYVVGGNYSYDNINSYININKKFECQSKKVSLFTSTSSMSLINDQLEKFWALEEVESKTILSPENEQSESIFKTNTIRLKSGRFQVSLPFKSSNEYLKLGDSFYQAKKRFIYLENRFSKNAELKQKYTASSCCHSRK
jgi:hypothetical protein